MAAAAPLGVWEWPLSAAERRERLRALFAAEASAAAAAACCSDVQPCHELVADEPEVMDWDAGTAADGAPLDHAGTDRHAAAPPPKARLAASSAEAAAAIAPT